MTLWISLALLSLVVIILMSWAGHQRVSIVRNDPITFYKDQLAEINADIEAGLLQEDEAETATLEIKRRMLKVGEKSSRTLSEGANVWQFYALGAMVIISSIMLYSIVGRPAIESKPYQPPQMLEQPIMAGSTLTFKQAIAEIKDRLQKDPSDIEGWTVLASTFSSLRRHGEAADAYSHATVLEPDNSTLHIKLGEQIMAMHSGLVVPAARNAFLAAIKIQSNHPGAHFYLGLAQKQAGNIEGAKRIWQGLIDRSAENAPWLSVVKRELDALDGGSTGPTADDVKAVQNMSKTEQAAFIDGMITRLRDKLKADQKNAEGWIMLARSEQTRGNIAAAITALEEGLKHVSENDKAALQNMLNSLKIE